MDPSGGSVQVTLVRTEVVLFFFFFGLFIRTYLSYSYLRPCGLQICLVFHDSGNATNSPLLVATLVMYSKLQISRE